MKVIVWMLNPIGIIRCWTSRVFLKESPSEQALASEAAPPWISASAAATHSFLRRGIDREGGRPSALKLWPWGMGLESVTKQNTNKSIIEKHKKKHKNRFCDCSFSNARYATAIVLNAVVLQLYFHTRSATVVVLIAVVLQFSLYTLICGIFIEIHWLRSNFVRNDGFHMFSIHFCNETVPNHGLAHFFVRFSHKIIEINGFFIRKTSLMRILRFSLLGFKISFCPLGGSRSF